MKIAYVTNRFPPAFGGAERFINFLLQEFIKREDFHADVFTSNFLNSTGNVRVTGNGSAVIFPSDKVRIHRLPSFRLFNRDALTIIPSLYNNLRKVNDYDLVHVFTYGYMTSWLPALMKSLNLLKPKLIFSPLYAPNTVYPVFLTTLYDTTLGKTSIKAADKILLLSEAFRQFFQKHNNNITVIPHPIESIPRIPDDKKVETKLKYRIPLNKKVILSISRLVKSKGIDLLINGVKDYIEHINSDIFLVIVGNGEESRALQEQINQLGLHNHAIILQHIADEERNALYNIGDIFALMSYSGEAFGITQIEAMSLGIPVIGNINGVARYIIKPGETGELVDPFKSETISEAIHTIFGRYKQYFTGPNTPASILNLYAPETVAAQFYNVYKEVISIN